MSATDEIKARLDIVNYIQQSVPLKKAGRYYKACCPFHNERTPSFVVNQESQSWRCFGACAEGGDIFSFAMKQQGWSFVEALDELGKQAGVEVRPRTPAQKQQTDKIDQLLAVVKEAAATYHDYLLTGADPHAQAALHYAREQRGFSDETLQRFGIGYAPPGWQNMLEHLTGLGYSEEQVVEAGIATRKEESGRLYDRFRNRLMIAIRDERGRVIGFGARALAADDNPKYLNSPQAALFDKSRVLFGLDVAKSAIRQSKTAVIVEGYMDAIQAHQAGFDNVVAQMGTALTEAQLRRVARWAQKIVLALDSDAAGQSATRRSLEVAREALKADFSGRLAVDIRILQIPEAKDPDDVIRETPDGWVELVEAALPVADYVIGMEMATLPVDASLQEKEAVARRLLPILLASENKLYTKDNLQRLALRLRIPEADLLVWEQEQSRIEQARPPRRHSQPATDGAPEFPPLDYEGLEAPVEDDDYTPVIDGASRRSAKPQAAHFGGALEAQCIRILFQQPDLYYQANRMFRELAGEDQALAQGALSGLCPEDFLHEDLRTLMRIFQAAISQDEMRFGEFVTENLDAALLPWLDTVEQGEREYLHNRVKQRFMDDFSAAWKPLEKQSLGGVDWETEFIIAALQIRLQRLQRERQEIELAQRDSQMNDDERLMLEPYGMQDGLRAKHLIDRELDGRRNSRHV